jgi:predicted DNA-binding protein (UPF0251 family)
VYAERGDFSRSVKLNISGASESFVARLLADLPRLIGGGIVGSMPSNRTQQQTADLFRASDQSTTTEESPERRQPQEPNVALTRGQVNAVRAAFKAGITPSRIARQFGISQSDVRKVLASESRRAGKGR